MCVLAASGREPTPWPGEVRVEGRDSTGDGLRWDPALTEASPAADRVLAWDVAAGLATRAGAWYQRVAGLRMLRPPRTLDDQQLAADAARLQATFASLGWAGAEVAVERRDSRHEVREDVAFVVNLGPRTAPVPLPPAPPDAGWRLVPIASALGRGATMSVYAGVDASWREAGERPDLVALYGELGARAFPDPDGEVSLRGNVGTFSDLRATWVRPLVHDTSSVLGARGGTDLWPGYNEASSTPFVGLQWGATDPWEVRATLGFGAWTSWAWPGQADAYRPWFEPGSPSPGRPRFLRRYVAPRVDLSVAFDTTDRRILPRSGVRARLAGTPIGLVEGAPMVRGEADGRWFVPLVGRWVIGTLRARAGALHWRDADGSSLLGERFFLEASDMRGWGSRRVVPPGYQGGPYELRPGGDAVVFGNAELRWDLHRDLTLAAFGDVGRVFEEPGQVNLADLVVDAGISGASPSPLGVVRLDLAVRLVEQELEDPWGFAIQLWLDQEW